MAQPHLVIVWLQRGLLIAGQLALLLPFLIVRDCSTEDETLVTGLQLYGQSPSLTGLAVAQLLAALLLLALAWRGGRDPAHTAAGLGLRGALAATAAVVALLAPVFAYLFDTLLPRVGWVLHAGSWLLLALACLFGAARAGWRLRGHAMAGAERVGIGLVLAAPLLVFVVLVLRDKSDAALAGLAGLLAGLPLALSAWGVGALVAAGAADRLRWRVVLWLVIALWLVFWLANLI